MNCLKKVGTYRYYLAESKFNLERAEKVYLVFGRHVVEPEIDQLIRVKRTSMTSIYSPNRKNDIRMARECRREHSGKIFQKKKSRYEEE